MANVVLEYLVTAKDMTSAATKSVQMNFDTMSKTVGANIEYINGASRRGRESMGQFAAGVAQVGRTAGSTQMVVGNLLYTIQDLPYGFRGVSNNLDFLAKGFIDMRTQLGGTRAAFAALGRSLMGPIGIAFAISGAIAAIQMLENAFRKSKKEADEAAASYKHLFDQLTWEELRVNINEYATQLQRVRKELQLLEVQASVTSPFSLGEQSGIKAAAEAILGRSDFARTGEQERYFALIKEQERISALINQLTKLQADLIKKAADDQRKLADETNRQANAMREIADAAAESDQWFSDLAKSIEAVTPAIEAERDAIREQKENYKAMLWIYNELGPEYLKAYVLAEDSAKARERENEALKGTRANVKAILEGKWGGVNVGGVLATKPESFDDEALKSVGELQLQLTENFNQLGLTAQNTANLITGAFESTADFLARVMVGAFDDIGEAFKRLVQSMLAEMAKLLIFEGFKALLATAVPGLGALSSIFRPGGPTTAMKPVPVEAGGGGASSVHIYVNEEMRYSSVNSRKSLMRKLEQAIYSEK